MFKAKICSLIIALLIIQNVFAKPLDDTDTETVTETATPRELEKFIKESSDAIAEKFRQMYREEIIVNGTYPELKWFQESLFITILNHDDSRNIDDHMEVVQYFLEMMKGSTKLTAKDVTPGLKAIEDLFAKYECMQLALDIEKRVKEWRLEEEKRKKIEELKVNGEKNE